MWGISASSWRSIYTGIIRVVAIWGRGVGMEGAEVVGAKDCGFAMSSSIKVQKQFKWKTLRISLSYK